MRLLLLAMLLISPSFAQEPTGYADYLYWRGPDWNSGLRTGLGCQLHGWEVTWDYTLFGADRADHWVFTSAAGDTEDRLWITEDLDYQVHDFQVARSFHADLFEFELFGGFRWGQVDYFIDDERHSLSSDNPSGRMTDGDITVLQSVSNTDSFGVRVGGEARCLLTRGLSAFGRGAISGLVSTTKHVYREGYAYQWDSGQPLSFWDVTRSDNHENHVVDAAAGFTWTHGRFELTTGYEWHIWSNVIQRSDNFNYFDYRDLIVDGFFARIGFAY